MVKANLVSALISVGTDLASLANRPLRGCDVKLCLHAYKIPVNFLFTGVVVQVQNATLKNDILKYWSEF